MLSFYRLCLLFFCLLTVFSACKKDNASGSDCFNPGSPTCDFANSRLVGAIYLTEAGDTFYRTTYLYDAQNRLAGSVSQEMGNGGICNKQSTINYVSQNRIRVINDGDCSGSGYEDWLYTVDGNGLVTQKHLYQGKDTFSIYQSRFHYDGQGQMTGYSTYWSEDIDNFQTLRLFDSVSYIWNEGNITQAKRYDTTGFTTINYLAGTDGRNAVMQSLLYSDELHLLYNPAVNRKWSKNMPDYPGDEYAFDGNSRIYCSKTDAHNIRTVFLYKCL